MNCTKVSVLLDRYATNELSERERSLVETHLTGCTACTRHLAGIRSLRGVIASARTETAPDILDAIRTEIPKTTAARGQVITIRERLVPRMPQLLTAAAAFAAVIAVAVITPRFTDRSLPWLSDTTRIKGTNAIFIYRKNGGSHSRYSNGALAHKGDIFQICYIVNTGGYGVLFSVDGRGSVTLHHPSVPDASTELKKNRETCLDRANELDDAPRYEKFYLAVSANTMNAASVIDTAKKASRRTDDLDAALGAALSNYSITTFTLRK